MIMSEQTWWDKEIKDQFLEFKSWVGDKNAPSKVWCRGFVKNHELKTLVDVGCGNATEFFAYKEEYPELEYLGVDSSNFLYEFNLSKGVPMIHSDADNTPLPDSSYDVAFSRHVLEHQKDPYPILDELVRVADKVAIHIFFIPPGEEEIINYDEKQNLYHNTFRKEDLEKHLNSKEKVEKTEWITFFTQNEQALIIWLQ